MHAGLFALVELVLALVDCARGLYSGQLERARALVGADWLAHPDCVGPVVVLGDFNSTPRSPAYRVLSTRLSDVQVTRDGRRPRHIWFSACPIDRIDHVFVSGGLSVSAVEVPRFSRVISASDHLPIVVDLELDLAAGLHPKCPGRSSWNPRIRSVCTTR